MIYLLHLFFTLATSQGLNWFASMMKRIRNWPSFENPIGWVYLIHGSHIWFVALKNFMELVIVWYSSRCGTTQPCLLLSLQCQGILKAMCTTSLPWITQRILPQHCWPLLLSFLCWCGICARFARKGPDFSSFFHQIGKFIYILGNRAIQNLSDSCLWRKLDEKEEANKLGQLEASAIDSEVSLSPSALSK